MNLDTVHDMVYNYSYISSLQMRKLNHNEVKELAQDRKCSKQKDKGTQAVNSRAYTFDHYITLILRGKWRREVKGSVRMIDSI